MHTYLLIILSCSRFQYSVLADDLTLKVGATGCEVANAAINKVMACNIFSKAENYILEKVTLASNFGENKHKEKRHRRI